jgi:hypothetical protein
VGIVKDGGSALSNHLFRVVCRQHVRTFEMHMTVDEPGTNPPAPSIVGLFRVSPGAAGMHTGDHGSGYADIGGTQFAGNHIHHGPTGDDQIKSGFALSR